MATYRKVNPYDLAVSLDQLVEDAFGVVSNCVMPGGGISPHEAIARLARLFETGSGWEVRLAAERLLRPQDARRRDD
jgi:hypothetical protein